MRSRRRIARLIAKKIAERDNKYVGFRQKDGTVKYILAENVMDVFADAVYGRETPGTRALLCAESATDGSLLHQLVQAMRRAPYVPETRSEVHQ